MPLLNVDQAAERLGTSPSSSSVSSPNVGSRLRSSEARSRRLGRPNAFVVAGRVEASIDAVVPNASGSLSRPTRLLLRAAGRA